MYFLFIRIRFTTVTYWQYAYLISVTCFYRFILLKSKKNFLVCARVADMSGRRTRYLLLPAILLRPLSNCQSSVAEPCQMPNALPDNVVSASSVDSFDHQFEDLSVPVIFLRLSLQRTLKQSYLYRPLYKVTD